MASRKELLDELLKDYQNRLVSLPIFLQVRLGMALNYRSFTLVSI
jgi:hypothetical protein